MFKYITLTTCVLLTASLSSASTLAKRDYIECNQQNARNPWSAPFDPTDSAVWAGISRCCQGTVGNTWVPTGSKLTCQFDAGGRRMQVATWADKGSFYLNAGYCEGYLDAIVKQCTYSEHYSNSGQSTTGDGNFRGTVEAKW